MTDLTEEQRGVIDKVEKLLRLASKNSSEAEAAAAAAKAQELLAAYNLDMAAVEQGGGQSGAREDAKLKGGVYQYQRDLWYAVAELNFCLYWTQQVWVKLTKRRKGWDGTLREYTDHKRQWQHRVVGRKVNTAATRAMAEYLEQAVERLVRERLGPNQNHMLFSRWAVSYREGAAANITERLWARRSEAIAREKARETEAGRAGVSTATALTLVTYSSQEDDANFDFIYGEGWSAKQAARRAEAAAKAKEAEDAYTAWAAAHPEEAAKGEAKRKAEEERRARRRTSRGKDYDVSAFYAGYDAGKSISLDQQVSDPKPAGMLK